MTQDGKPDLARRIWLTSVALIAVIGIFAAGFLSAFMQNGIYRSVFATLAAFHDVAEEGTNILPGGSPVHFLQPSTHDGDGVTVNTFGASKNDLVLLSGFFNGTNGLRLIRRDGTVVARWDVSYLDLFPNRDFIAWTPAQSDMNIDTHGAVAMPDGSVVFNFDYGGAARIDRCGKAIWTLPFATHHSMERAESGGFWALGRELVARRGETKGKTDYYPFSETTPGEFMVDDEILHISDDGEILAKTSLTKVFFESGLKPLLTATGTRFWPYDEWDGEIIHANKIVELPAALANAFPEFSPGDLLLSVRERNLLAVIDGTTLRVKWYQIGPWLRQHDPEFGSDGRIYLFNNNTFLGTLEDGDHLPPEAPRVSEILAFNPSDGSVERIYGNVPGQEIMSAIRGKIDLQANGDIMVTEFEAGRAFEFDPAGQTVWEYVNRYDADNVAEMTEVRTYPADYFTVTDWSCS